MTNFSRLLVFALEGQRYGLALDSVETVFHAVELTPLPQAPEIVLGIVNVRGRVLPVVDIRKRFGMPARELLLEDRLIIAVTPARSIAILADRVDGVMEIDEQEIVKAARILEGPLHVEGVVKLADGLLLIHDLAGFLSLGEERAVSRALRENGSPP
jgi:purine-binding chemotaxis protein CheW